MWKVCIIDKYFNCKTIICLLVYFHGIWMDACKTLENNVTDSRNSEHKYLAWKHFEIFLVRSSSLIVQGIIGTKLVNIFYINSNITYYWSFQITISY